MYETASYLAFESQKKASPKQMAEAIARGDRAVVIACCGRAIAVQS
ncbi:hypothetical protein NG799_12155 [Laspinema sp. D1]|uniref:Uncharacterized protein n=1 Tax=Laspinema palackyanum D2a TaxID=2953684 RepID=A0ABT2MQR4_9CYAN|nr:hypothetical protein [Laspinema sp. D2a]